MTLKDIDVAPAAPTVALVVAPDNVQEIVSTPDSVSLAVTLTVTSVLFHPFVGAGV